MKSLALDLDSGRLSRWEGDTRSFSGWSDRYGDLYSLRVQLYCSSGGKVQVSSPQLLVKRKQRRDTKAQWNLAAFSRKPSFLAPSSASYVGQVDASGPAYRSALKLDASPGNDLPKVDFLGILRVVSSDRVVEAEFNYELVNSGYRAVDSDQGASYVGVSDSGAILLRNVDGIEWRELVIYGTGSEASFALGDAVLGPVSSLTADDAFARVNNGVLQLKNDDNGAWVNVLLRGPGGSTLSLGETPPVGFTTSPDSKYKVADDGRLLIRNLTSGNWHEARVQLASGTNILALGNEYNDSEV